jgi:surface protein
MQNVTSTLQILVDFGTPLNPTPSAATYRLKVSNGNGTFKHLKFGIPNSVVLSGVVLSWTLFGSSEKLIDIEQWGHIHWDSMNAAFVECKNMQMSATDIPDLSGVTDTSYMFHNAMKFFGNSSMAFWDTSTIRNFRSMFAYGANNFTVPPDFFNPPIGSWNTSSAENLSFMFNSRKSFNQNLNSWNVSNVKDFSFMFASCDSFNQPVDQWDVSNAKDISYMFHYIPDFNQSLSTWNTSNVVNMEHIFHGDAAFNQPLETWDVSNVTNMDTSFSSASSFNQPLSTWDTRKVTNMMSLFSNATSFNQSLETWNLRSLTSPLWMITQAGLDCNNYSQTLKGWAQNQETPNNLMLGPLSPYVYSPDVSVWRDALVSKGWTFIGDNIGECRMLGVSDRSPASAPTIFPNPAENFIYIKNISDKKSYVILDASGRIAAKDVLTKDTINIGALTPGNYFLQIITKDKIHTLKFIKK